MFFTDLFERHRRQILTVVILCALAALVTFEPVAEGYDYISAVESTMESLEILGLMLIVAAIAGRAWCSLYIGGRKSRELVQAGPYSVTRNPLYVFSTIGAAGAGAISESVVIMIVAALGCLAISFLLIEREERRLSDLFGDKFAVYAQRVPRFWPQFSLYHDGGEITFTPRHLAATVRDGLVFLAAYPFFEGVEMLHEWGVIPVLFRLY